MAWFDKFFGVTIQIGGVTYGIAQYLNLVANSGITITPTVNPATGTITLNIEATGGGSGTGPFVALVAGGTINPQVDTDYACSFSAPATVVLASTIPDGTKIGFYDAAQNWITNNLTVQDQGGYHIRNPWNIAAPDTASLVMGGVGDAVNGQSFVLKKYVALTKWLC